MTLSRNSGLHHTTTHPPPPAPHILTASAPDSTASSLSRSISALLNTLDSQTLDSYSALRTSLKVHQDSDSKHSTRSSPTCFSLRRASFASARFSIACFRTSQLLSPG